jgi:hypothetical protein
MQIKQPLNVNKVEKKASEIASFLKLPLKGIQ